MTIENENEDFQSVFDGEATVEISEEAQAPEEVQQEPEPDQGQSEVTQPEDNSEGEDIKGGVEDENAQKDEDPKLVPIAALHEERDARKALKSEVSGLQSQLQEMQNSQQQLMQFIQSQAQQQTAKQNEQQFVDPLEDPSAFVNNVENRVQELIEPVQQNMQHQEIAIREQNSFMQAQMQHGPEIVQAAIDAAHDAGLTNQFRSQSVNPVGDAVEWYKKQQILSQTGGDLNAYTAQIIDKAKAEAIAEMQANQGQQAQTKPLSKDSIPPSLNKQTGATDANASETDGDFFKSIF